MIICHKHKFIFIKTRKTAGTSIESLLSQLCDNNDIITPINPPINNHLPRNYTGYFNIFKEIIYFNDKKNRLTSIGDFTQKRKFFNHISAERTRLRVGDTIWNSYFKFAVERDPIDKSMSHYWHWKSRFDGKLTFDEYLDRGDYCLNYPLYTDSKGEVIIDKILSFENLNQELSEVFDILGLNSRKLQLPREKSSYRANKSIVLNDSQIEHLKMVFSKETDLLRKHNITK